MASQALRSVSLSQFTQPELASAYGDALRAAGGTTLEAVLHGMGDGSDAALELGEFDVRGGTRLTVLAFDRAKLARCVGGNVARLITVVVYQ